MDAVNGSDLVGRLGQDVAAAQDRQLASGSAVEEARERLFAPAPSTEGRRGFSRGSAGWFGLAAAAMALAAAVVVMWPSPPQLTFAIAGQPGQEGAWVTVPAEATTNVSFSDGTQVWLSAGTRARVDDLDEDGAEIDLERGGAHLAVVHQDDDTSWHVEAGPYDVFVTGTEFSVSWDPATERFRLSMVEGSVEVAGPRIEGRRVLVAGQSLDLKATPTAVGQVGLPSSPSSPLAQRPSEASSTEATDPSAPAADATAQPGSMADGPAADPRQGPQAALPAPAQPRPSEEAESSEAPDWRALAAQGKYPEAYAAAAPGFDSILQLASVSDLMVLADVARYAGQAARSRQAYRTVRSRFPGTPQAARAAFALGRSGGGGQWFAVYLQEAPDGPLAREALGRLLESQRGSDAAPGTARRYLARYPNGPHASLARSVLSAGD